MQIKKIILNNFRQFYSSNEIEFEIDDSKNTTIIMADNGIGKTTLLQSFIFCLYGIEEVKLNDKDKLLNYHRGRTMAIGEQEDVSVTLEFIQNNVEYIATRKVSYIKNNDGNIYKLNTRFECYYIESETGITKPLNGESKIRELIPVSLSKFFFFDGERMEQLASTKSKGDLSSSVCDILGIDHLKQAMRHLGSEANKTVKSTARYKYCEKMVECSNEENFVAKAKMQAASNRIESNEELIEEKELKKEEYNNRISELEAELTSIQEAKLIQNKRKNFIHIRQQDEDLREELHKKLYSSFFKEIKNRLLINEGKHIIDKLNSAEMVTKGRVGVTQSAIDDIIKRKECICGRGVHEHTPEYKCLIEMRNYLPPASMSVLIEHFSNEYKNRNQKAIKYQDTFYADSDKIISLIDKIQQTTEEIEECGAKLKLLNNPDIDKIEIERNDLRGRLDKVNYDLGQLVAKIEEDKRLYNKIEKEVREFDGLNNINKEIKYKISIVDKIYNTLNNDFIKKERDTKELLNNEIKDKFGIIFNGNYTIELDDQYSFNVYNDQNRKINAVLSEGQKVVTSFAFVGGLISTAKKCEQAEEHESEFFPLVMDAPFSKLDDAHRKNVAKFVPNLADQVIILCVDNQWDGVIKDNIESKVSGIYEMKRNPSVSNSVIIGKRN